MMHRPWSSIVEVPYCFSRSNVKFQGHTALKIVKFYRNWAFLDSNSSLNSLMVMKCCTKLETAKERCPIVFQSHPSNFKVTRDKTSPLLTRIGRFRTIGRSQLSNPSDLPCLLLKRKRWIIFIPYQQSWGENTGLAGFLLVEFCNRTFWPMCIKGVMKFTSIYTEIFLIFGNVPGLDNISWTMFFFVNRQRSHWISVALILTHLPWDKMAAFSQTIYSDAFLWMKSFCIFIKISLKFVLKGQIDDNPALV